MAQNTNSVAYNRLSGVKNDIGSIVQEHQRYWKKYDDEQAAAERASALAAKKFQADQNKEYRGLIDKMPLDESKGYTRDQIVTTFQADQEGLADLARKATFENDNEAYLKYQRELENYSELVSMDKVFQEKSAALLAKPDQENPYLDKDKKKFLEVFAEGKYKINKDKSVTFQDPKNLDSTVTLSPSQLKSEIQGLDYSGSPKFEENATEVAKGLLNTDDGQKLITPLTRSRGITAISGRFADNPVLSESWLQKLKTEGDNNGNTFQTDKENYDDLTSVEKTKLQGMFYDDQVQDLVQEVKTDTRAEDYERSLRIQKAKKDLEEGNGLSVRVLADESGRKVTDIDFGGRQIKFDKDDTIIESAAGQDFKPFLSSQNNEFTPSAIRFKKNGDVAVYGKEEVKRSIIVKDNNGATVFSDYIDEDGNPIPERKTETTYKDVYYADKATVDEAVTQLNYPGSNRKINSLQEARSVFNEIAPKQENEKAVYKGLDSEGNPIFE